MSSLVVDLRRKFDEVPGYIRFRLFNVTHEMHLVRFNELLHLPAYGALIPEREDYTARSFCALSLVLGNLIRRGLPRPP